MKKKYLGIILIIAILVIASFFIYNYPKNVYNKFEDKYEVDTLFLKVAISQNKSAINNIKIKNTYFNSEHFKIKINQLEDFVNLNESDFNLESNKTKNIQIKFKSGNNKPGVYLGELEILTKHQKKKIPIIFEIHSEDVLFEGNINLFMQGRDIVSGQKLNAEIKIFDLANIGRSRIKFSYFVMDFENRIFNFESEKIIVDGQYDYSKTFKTENMKPGNYVLIAIIEYENSIGVSSRFFKISEEENKKILEYNMIFLIIGVFSFFFLVFLGLFVYFMFYRDKLLKELQSQYKKEIKRQKEIIQNKEKEDYQKLKNPFEKKEYKKEIKKIKKERIKILRSIYKERLKKFEILRKKSNKSKLKKQLEKWKSQGYDTKVLEKNFKIPDILEIKRKINKWKSQGYDTRVLEKSKNKFHKLK